ncbi:MAG: CPBP family intramembrane metalloprotease [Lachnospiraceae bacterium]|nr:CPBP family intramembrane metalloprotease [Lachnospiraceae bacterium]
MNEYDGFNQNQKTRKGIIKPGPLAAMIIFIIVILSMIFVFSFAQYYLGMWGLIITEVGILIIALLGMVATGMSIKEMLPVKAIHLNEIFGVIIMWASTFMIVMVINLGISLFTPEVFETGSELDTFFSGWPALASFLVLAVSPAICEEVLHRGFIQRCFCARITNKFVISFIVGLLFGINHLDPIRLIGTGVLGGVMAYILLETDNFLYNMFFHFLNNGIIHLISFGAGDVTQEVDIEATMAMLPLGFASYLIIGCVAPLIFVGGMFLLKGRKKLREWGKTKIIVSISVAFAVGFLMILGAVLIFSGLYLSGDLYEIISQPMIFSK